MLQEIKTRIAALSDAQRALRTDKANRKAPDREVKWSPSHYSYEKMNNRSRLRALFLARAYLKGWPRTRQEPTHGVDHYDLGFEVRTVLTAVGYEYDKAAVKAWLEGTHVAAEALPSHAA